MLEDRKTELPRQHRASGRSLVRTNERLKGYAVVLEPHEAVQFLVMSAREYDITACTKVGCDICHELVDTWHGVYEALADDERKDVATILSAAFIPAPEYPEQRY